MIEKPRDVYSTGRRGTGSMKGLKISHVAVGMSTARAALPGRDRGCSGGAMSKFTIPRQSLKLLRTPVSS